MPTYILYTSILRVMIMPKILFFCLCFFAVQATWAQVDTPKADKKKVLTISSEADAARHDKSMRTACDKQAKADEKKAADELARMNAEMDAYIRSIDWDAETQRAIEGYGNVADEPKDKKNNNKPK